MQQQLSAGQMRALPQQTATFIGQVKAGKTIAFIMEEFESERFSRLDPAMTAAHQYMFRRVASEDTSIFLSAITAITDKLHNGTGPWEEMSILAFLNTSVPNINSFRSFPFEDRGRALHAVISVTLGHLYRMATASKKREKHIMPFLLLRRLLLLLHRKRADALHALVNYLRAEDQEYLQTWQNNLHAVIALSRDPSKIEPNEAWLLVSLLAFVICLALRIAPPPDHILLEDSEFAALATKCIDEVSALKRLDMIFATVQQVRPLVLRSTDDYICLTCGSGYFSGGSDPEHLFRHFKVCSLYVQLGTFWLICSAHISDAT